MDLETLLKFSGVKNSEVTQKELKDNAQTDEAVGVAADPIMDLCDDVGCDPDHPIFAELVRYMDGDTIRDFVSDYRRNHDMPNGMDEAKVVEATWPKSDDDESAPQVGDTVMHDKHGLVKVLKITDTDMMGEPAEYVVQTKGGDKKISYDQLVMGEAVEGAKKVSEAFDKVDRITNLADLNIYDKEEEMEAREMSAADLKDELEQDIYHLMDKASDDFTDNDYIADEMGDNFASMHLNADDATLSCYVAMRDMMDEDPAAVYETGKQCLKILGAQEHEDNVRGNKGPMGEDSEEITNTGREESMKTDRDSVTIDMVKPAIEKMLSSYEADAKEWNDNYAEMEKEVRAKGVTDPRQIEIDVFNMDDDIVSYVNIDDLEDKIDAIKRLMKQGDADGHDIVDLASSGPSDTIAREQFMQELKYAIKQDYPDLYSKLFMYDIGESEGSKVQEDYLGDMLKLAGLYQPVEEEATNESYFKDMVQDVEEGMTKEKFAEKYPGSASKYEEIKKEIEDRMAESVDEVVEDQETVEVTKEDLTTLLDLAGIDPQATDRELDEYANSPDEDYRDSDYMLNKLAGGLNGPKTQTDKGYPGDNPLAAKLAGRLQAMLDDMNK